MDTQPSRKKICDLNDVFRQTFIGGRVVITAGVNAHADETNAAVIAKVKTFTAFTSDNDPHGELYFANFEEVGEKFFGRLTIPTPRWNPDWKIPADESVATRVLSILLAEEY